MFRGSSLTSTVQCLEVLPLHNPSNVKRYFVNINCPLELGYSFQQLYLNRRLVEGKDHWYRTWL